MTPKISLQHISKAFGSKTVLRDVSLSVATGESLVIIGGSGSGKSVTIKTILGLIAPDSGTVLIDGADLTHAHRRQRKAFLDDVGMLFQGAALFDSLPVWQNVAFGLIEGKGMKKSDAHEIAIDKLSRVGLGPEVASLFPSELSGGMQKRVGLARAIAGDPSVIFFDEPTTGLDPIMADIINDLIVECVRDLGATTMTITHDMASARKIADRMAMLYNGRIIWEGPKADIDSSGDPHVDQFIHGRADGPISMQLRNT